ncbi:transporter [Altererythrobacter sp. Root672]|uniref:SphA family protein n=1 Tax=Altererythrobacter sp. Root672 TaxID=1736584 RepID=UPI001F191CEE|nr:transporter [Altererythrobacter sp. Root672]
MARRCAGPAFVATAVALSTPAAASEGGASFYLLGSGGPEAAVLPPVEGVFLDNTMYFYSGEASVDREFVIGGNVVAGINADIFANFTTLLWVPSTDVLGGTLALGTALPIGRPAVDASVVLTGPRGNQVSVNREDSAWVIGDPVATAALAWNLDKETHLQFGTMVNIPIGQYREDQLANLSFHRWIVDASLAATWHNEAGWDLSTKTGITFNGTNNFTDYNTGTELHWEASVEKTLSKQVSLGLQAYHYQQISGDSGTGAVLGPNKGEVSAVGVTGAYNFVLGKTPVTARVRVFEEFNTTRRLDGTAVFFSLTLPISMKLPPGAGG